MQLLLKQMGEGEPVLASGLTQYLSVPLAAQNAVDNVVEHTHTQTQARTAKFLSYCFQKAGDFGVKKTQ